jgi:hypothetical protein
MPTVEKLCKSLKDGYARLDSFRMIRNDFVREYTGRLYGKGDNVRRPVNLIAQYVFTLVPSLINQNPRHNVTSRLVSLGATAELLGMSLDQLWDQLNALHTMQNLIVDSLLSPCGIAKVGQRAGSEMVKVDDRDVPRGAPYFARIDFDDYAIDPAAREPGDAFWEGHRYRMPRYVAQSCGLFDPDLITKLPKLGDESTRNSALTEELSLSNDNSRFDLQDMIELWDLAVYAQDATYICTVPNPESQAMLLNAGGEPIPYEGADRSPYLRLDYYTVPNNAVPLCPAMAWNDLHEAADKVYARMIRQALRSKNVFAYNKSKSDDALQLQAAADGDAVAVDDVETLKAMPIGGIMGDMYQFLDSLQGHWNNIAGNMQLLGGQEVQGDTATANQIVAGRAQVRVKFMQDRVKAFCDKLAAKLGYMLIKDPLIKIPQTYRVPGGDKIQLPYDAATREGDFCDFDFKIHQTTLNGMDPAVVMQQRIAMLQSLAQFLPFAQVINLSALARQMGQQIGWDDMDAVIQDPAHQQMLQMLLPPMPSSLQQTAMMTQIPQMQMQAQMQAMQQQAAGQGGPPGQGPPQGQRPPPRGGQQQRPGGPSGPTGPGQQVPMGVGMRGAFGG